MTLERLIYCNLCNRRLEPNETLGVLWTGMHSTIEERPALQVEHHVCFSCLDGLLSIAQERGFCKRTESWPGEIVEKRPSSG